jgi:diguanylate cyclase (GGDEF)-like protein/PAS domain S-box-containing protein
MTSAVQFELSSRIEALDRLLALRPHAAVVAIDEHGLFAPMPESVPLDGHPRLEGRSGIELTAPADRKALVDAWLRMLASGLSRIVVTLVTGDRAAFHFIDLRGQHGAILGLVVPEAASPTSANLETAAVVVPRVARIRRNERGIILEAGDALPAMLGRPHDQLVGHSSVEIITADDAPGAIGSWMEMLANPGQTHRWRGRYVRGDGTLLWVETINQNRLIDPEHRDVLSEVIDISEEMAAVEALRSREQLLHRLTEALPEAVIQIDAARRIVHANGRVVEMLGQPIAATIDAQFRAMLGKEWRRLDAAIRRMLGGNGDHDLEIRSGAGNGLRVFAFTLRGLVDGAGAASGGLVCVSDVTERSRMRTELEERATFDALTGCHNRASIMATLERVLAESAHPHGHGTAVAFIDIDQFKVINDRSGHAAGDEVLTLVAGRLRDAVRSNDIVGRLGGDEFLVVCPNAGSAGLARIGRRIRRAIAVPASVSGFELNPRASVGIAWTLHGAADVDRLIAAADAAMYESKARGVGRPVIRLLDAPSPTNAATDRAAAA